MRRLTRLRFGSQGKRKGSMRAREGECEAEAGDSGSPSCAAFSPENAHGRRLLDLLFFCGRLW